jgi:hypothetical protein
MFLQLRMSAAERITDRRATSTREVAGMELLAERAQCSGTAIRA